MNREVFLSLLALDAYNRNYGQTLLLNKGDSFTGVNEVDQRIGTARISAQEITDEAQSAGFYAIAYDWNNSGNTETAISFRGPNFPNMSTA
jgi:hypothetical protein